MRLFAQIIFILVIVSTISICAIKPQMHKTVLVYDSDYKIVQEDETIVERTEIPIMEMPAAPEQKTAKVEVKVEQIPVKTKSNTVKTVEKSNPAKYAETVINKNAVALDNVKTKVDVQQPIKQNITTATQEQTPKVLTQKEEEIAWNIWRSNLQNKIMQDVHLPALPNGVIFRFSFNVDNYGKITNIYTYSDNPEFTPYAIQYIAPVIRSYQGKSILNFPEGSSRLSTKFKGGWKISSTERLSTPQDYNDYEKVIKVND